MERKGFIRKVMRGLAPAAFGASVLFAAGMATAQKSDLPPGWEEPAGLPPGAVRLEDLTPAPKLPPAKGPSAEDIPAAPEEAAGEAEKEEAGQPAAPAPPAEAMGEEYDSRAQPVDMRFAPQEVRGRPMPAAPKAPEDIRMQEIIPAPEEPVAKPVEHPTRAETPAAEGQAASDSRTQPVDIRFAPPEVRKQLKPAAPPPPADAGVQGAEPVEGIQPAAPAEEEVGAKPAYKSDLPAGWEEPHALPPGGVRLEDLSSPRGAPASRRRPQVSAPAEPPVVEEPVPPTPIEESGEEERTGGEPSKKPSRWEGW